MVAREMGRENKLSSGELKRLMGTFEDYSHFSGNGHRDREGGGLEWESEEGKKNKWSNFQGKLRLQKMLQRMNLKNKCAQRPIYMGWKEGGDLRMVAREMGRKTKFQWRAERLMGTLEDYPHFSSNGHRNKGGVRVGEQGGQKTNCQTSRETAFTENVTAYKPEEQMCLITLLHGVEGRRRFADGSKRNGKENKISSGELKD
ncbi:hypothetical protein CEXT_664171 [Caerostris extrusa]|uniref:Uncharacterized protein n=1 Tax=Caerostris extrusa TaxID=172846 RepID=A0AAV4RJ49_CAEEX|nr:hypothetical protein CEXT_664171 [Caerostris extrusa]